MILTSIITSLLLVCKNDVQVQLACGTWHLDAPVLKNHRIDLSHDSHFLSTGDDLGTASCDEPRILGLLEGVLCSDVVEQCCDLGVKGVECCILVSREEAQRIDCAYAVVLLRVDECNLSDLEDVMIVSR